MPVSSNSAAQLRALWNRYSDRYESQIGHKMSMREMSHQLGFDPSTFAHWCSESAPPRRRVPLHQIPHLAKALLASDEETDALMMARISELPPDGETAVACCWLAQFLARDGPDQEEALLLRTFNELRGHFPRGLYLDQEESTTLREMLASLLRRAQELAFEEAAAEPETTTGTSSCTPRTRAPAREMAKPRQGPSIFLQSVRNAKKRLRP